MFVMMWSVFDGDFDVFVIVCLMGEGDLFLVFVIMDLV